MLCQQKNSCVKFLLIHHILLSHHHVYVLTNRILLTHIFCWISWFLLKQQIFAYSAISCCVIIRHFDNSASFCWHNVFIAESAHFGIFVLSHHHVYALTNQFLLTHIFCWISWFLLRQHFFFFTQLSFVESSSGILITQQVFADTAYFFLTRPTTKYVLKNSVLR